MCLCGRRTGALPRLGTHALDRSAFGFVRCTLSYVVLAEGTFHCGAYGVIIPAVRPESTIRKSGLPAAFFWGTLPPGRFEASNRHRTHLRARDPVRGKVT